MTTTDFSEFESTAQDLAKITAPSKEKLNEISSLAWQLQNQRRLLERAEEKIKEIKAAIDKIECFDLPDAMRDVGMRSFTLDDGTDLSLVDEAYVGIPEPKRSEAYQWLRDHGFGDLIKTQLNFTFGMGDEDKAFKLKEIVHGQNEYNFEFDEKVAVLPQTLKAFVREQDRKGRTLPETLFSIHRITRAKFGKKR